MDINCVINVVFIELLFMASPSPSRSSSLGTVTTLAALAHPETNYIVIS